MSISTYLKGESEGVEYLMWTKDIVIGEQPSHHRVIPKRASERGADERQIRLSTFTKFALHVLTPDPLGCIQSTLDIRCTLTHP